MIDDLHARMRQAEALLADAVAARSMTREGALEITSRRQLRICEDAGRRILALQVADEELNRAAVALLNEVRLGRRWTWTNEAVAASLLVLAVAVGLGAAVIGGLSDNIALVVLGALVSSVMLGLTVLRYRRENWRIRTDKVAPMIWKPGL